MKNIFKKFQQMISSGIPILKKTSIVKRAIRIKLHEKHQVFFYIEKVKIEINNMNSTGIGLCGDSFKILPTKNDIIKGSLVIENDSYPIELQVVYAGKNVGCRITNITSKCANKISEYFSYELIASKLYPLKTEILKPDPDGVPFCYVGEDSCELFFIEKNKKLVRFSLTIFGNYIEVDKNHHLHHGKISTDNENIGDIARYRKTDMILVSQNSPTDETKEKLEKFILNIDNLANEYKLEMINHLKKAV